MILRPLSKLMIFAQRAGDAEQRHAIQIEHRLGLRMIAGLHAVAGQAQHVAHAHRRTAQNIALNRDPVLVAAGNLHDRRIADARQQRANRETRHMAVRAAAVGRIDRIDVAVEHPRTLINVFRVGRIGRCEFGRDREPLRAQHPLETPRRGMAGQDRQRIPRHRFIVESHGAAPGRDEPADGGTALADGGTALAGGAAVLSRTTRSQEERPCCR